MSRRFAAAARPVAVVAGAAVLGLDLEHEALDRDHPHRVAGRDRGRPVRPGPPQRVADPHDAVGINGDLGRAHLADHALAPDRRRREAGPDERRASRTRRRATRRRSRARGPTTPGRGRRRRRRAQIEPADERRPPRSPSTDPSPPACTSIGEPERRRASEQRDRPPARPGGARSRSTAPISAIAPTAPAIPTLAVKNSNTISASPARKRKYAIDGSDERVRAPARRGRGCRTRPPGSAAGAGRGPHRSPSRSRAGRRRAAVWTVLPSSVDDRPRRASGACRRPRPSAPRPRARRTGVASRAAPSASRPFALGERASFARDLARPGRVRVVEVEPGTPGRGRSPGRRTPRARPASSERRLAPFASAPDGPTHTTTGTFDVGSRARACRRRRRPRPCESSWSTSIVRRSVGWRRAIASRTSDAFGGSSRPSTCTTTMPASCPVALRVAASRTRRRRAERPTAAAPRARHAATERSPASVRAERSRRSRSMRAMELAQFCSTSRVVIVAGKGGVGKTTVTATLGDRGRPHGRERADRRGRGQIGARDGASASPPLAYDEVEVAARHPGPDPHARRRRSSSTSRTAGCSGSPGASCASGALDVVATAVPGMKDILVLGKVKSLEQARRRRPDHRRRPRRPGTRSRSCCRRAGCSTRCGSARSASRPTTWSTLLSDPARCQVMLVTLPEETPVNEVIDTAFAIEDRVGVALGPVVVNELPARLAGRGAPARATTPRSPGVALVPTRGRRPRRRGRVPPRAPRARSTSRSTGSRERLPLPQIQLPFLFDEIGPTAESSDARRRARPREVDGDARERAGTRRRSATCVAEPATSSSAAAAAASARRRPRRCSRSRARAARPQRGRRHDRPGEASRRHARPRRARRRRARDRPRALGSRPARAAPAAGSRR